MGKKEVINDGKRYDAHIHSVYSPDSIVSPDQIVKRAKSRNLEGVAVTDHETIAGALKTQRIAKEKNVELDIIIGEEIKTQEGEVIGLFLNEEIKGFKKPFGEVIDAIKEQGGIVVIPHPFDSLRRVSLKFDLVNLKGIDAIEVFNSRVINGAENRKALEFAIKNKKAFCAGSDAHTPIEIGNAVTIAKEDLKKELKDRKTSFYGVKSPVYVHAVSKFVKNWRRLWGYEYDTVASH